jgi:enamine deaminase RidA (YjgF/YER057c/UK114 family)
MGSGGWLLASSARGNTTHVSGTTAADANGNIVGVGDAYAQTIQVLKNIQSALERADADMRDVA